MKFSAKPNDNNIGQKGKIMGSLITRIIALASLFFVLPNCEGEEEAAGTETNEDGIAQHSLTHSNNLTGSPSTTEYVPGEVIVRFRPQVVVNPQTLSTNSANINNIFSHYGVSAIQQVFTGTFHQTQFQPNPNLDLSNIYQIRIPEDRDIRNIIEELNRDRSVEYAEPNYIRHTCETIPDDPLFPEQWGLDIIRAPEAWDIEQGDPDIVVAVIDTGVDYMHPDLFSNIWNNEREGLGNGIDDDGNGYIDDIVGYDFVSVDPIMVAPGEDPGPRDNDPMDRHGHGTSVAGIIGAVPNNGIGIAGVNWNARIMALRAGYRTPDGNGSLSDSDSAAAISYAADNGASVINMSWGGYAPSMLWEDAINYASSAGCVLIASAGNDGTRYILYPAAYENVLAIAATDESDNKAIWGFESSSNYGEYIDVAAPGNNLYTTLFGGGYGLSGGTSLAAPYVSGLAALVLSHAPFLSNESVYHIIRSSADDVFTNPRQQYLGSGRINLLRALSITEVPILNITSPRAGEIITESINITGTVSGDSFRNYRIEYGQGTYPLSWAVIRESSTSVVGGTLAAWDISTLECGPYKIRIIVNDNIRHEVVVFIEKGYRPGWPVTPPGPIYSDTVAGPVIGDIDGDGQEEIVAGDFNGNISVFNTDGIQLPGWPIRIADHITAVPSLADINQDGFLEILVGSCQWERDNFLHVLDQNGTALSGWPVNLGTHCPTSPVISDIDHNGTLEIIAATNSGAPAEPYLYIWRADGINFPSWPRLLTSSADSSSTPSVGDIDDDGNEEIIVGFDNGEVYVVNNDGRISPGWPQTVPYYGLWSRHVDTAIADVNNDGAEEIVANCRTEVMHIWNANGLSMPGWPNRAPNRAVSSPAIGDLDNDGDLEMIFYSNIDKIYGFHHDGTTMSNWPIQLQEINGNVPWPPAVLADIDEDRIPDILDVGEGNVWAWHLDSNELPGSCWPRYLPTRYSNSISVSDIDRDGNLELIVSTNERIYLWNLNMANSGAEWPQFQHDARHTGNYHADVTPPEISHVPVRTTSVGSSLRIRANITDDIEVRMARIFYRTTTSPTYEFVLMTNTGGDTWEGEIPAGAVTMDGVQYYIVTHDTSINPAIEPLSAPTTTHEVTVIDDIPPTIHHVPVAEAPFGSELTINAEIIDNAELGIVELRYRIRGSAVWRTLSMRNTGGDNFSARIPGTDMTLAGLEYYIEAIDSSDNITTSPIDAPSSIYSVNVIDDLSPLISHSPIATATFGEDLSISANISDNVEVTNAQVYYRTSESASWHTISMRHTGGEIYAGIIPAADINLEGLEYYLEATDSSDNSTTSPIDAPSEVYTVSVIDETLPDETPPNIRHRPVLTAYLTNDLPIYAGISDDIRIENAHLYYRITGTPSWQTLEMIETTRALYRAIISSLELDARGLEYYIEASDTSDNSATSPADAPASSYEVTIIDNLAPAAPTNLEILESEDNELSLTWSSPETNIDGRPLTDLAGYIIAYRDIIEGEWTEIDVGLITTGTIFDLINEHEYELRVLAYDNADAPNRGPWSDSIFATPINRTEDAGTSDSGIHDTGTPDSGESEEEIDSTGCGCSAIGRRTTPPIWQSFFLRIFLPIYSN